MENKIQLGTGEDPLGSDRFEQLVRDHERRVLAIAYQICGDLEDARDVAQEAFLRAFLYRLGFRPEQRFSSWLNRITVNAALDLLRKRSQGDFQPKTAEILESREKSFPEPSPEDQLCSREEEKRLFSLLDLLAPRERAAFVLRYLQGMSTLEVARSMGCTRVTVRRHATRARAKLQRALLTGDPGGEAVPVSRAELLEPVAEPLAAPGGGKK